MILTIGVASFREAKHLGVKEGFGTHPLENEEAQAC
jgi:hypothetical protein